MTARAASDPNRVRPALDRHRRRRVGVCAEHVHERDDHHPKATVHRHFAPHHTRATSGNARLDDDEHVIWLTTAWLQVAMYHGPSAVSTSATWCGFALTIDQWSAIVLDDAAPPHGPPRVSRSLRALPFPA